MDKHISLARELGYEGQELRDYLKRQQDLEREERLAQREYEREKREAEQKEKDRELEKMKIEAARKDKEVEKLKIEAARKDKEMEMEKEVALKKLRPKWNSKKSRPRPLHIPGGPKRKVQILGVPSFHTLTNIRIRWIAI